MKTFSTDRSLRRFQLAGYLSVLAIVGVGGAWSVLTSLNGAVIAPATIIAESNAKRVQHKDGGIVRKILVRDGERVSAGQDLIELDDTDTRSELGILDSLLVEALAKRARLEAQRDDSPEVIFPEELEARRSEPSVGKVMAGQVKLHGVRLAAMKGKFDQLNQQIGQIGEQIDGITAQIEAKERQIDLIKSELVDLRGLKEKGLTPNSRVMSMEREQARLEGERGELIGSRAAAKSKSGEIRIQILQISEEFLSQALLELRETEGRVAELTERRLAAQARLNRMVIKAPITGTIYQLMVHTEGGVITPAEPLMMIAPEADELVLQAQIKPQNIEQISEGQKAQIRFASFNSHTTPELWAEVFSVAADTTRINAETPPFYDIRIRISKGELARLEGKQLKPGMPAEAFIQTGARSPLSYLLKPLRDQIEYAWRER